MGSMARLQRIMVTLLRLLTQVCLIPFLLQQLLLMFFCSASVPSPYSPFSLSSSPSCSSHSTTGSNGVYQNGMDTSGGGAIHFIVTGIFNSAGTIDVSGNGGWNAYSSGSGGSVSLIHCLCEAFSFIPFRW